MRIWNSCQHFRDLIVEEVALQAKLLLNDHEVADLLSVEELANSPFAKDGSPLAQMTFRPEHLEEFILNLRYRIGNLQDQKASAGKLVDLAKHLAANDPEHKFREAFSRLMTQRPRGTVLGEKDFWWMVEETGLAPEVVTDAFLFLGEYQQRTLRTFFADMQPAEWDGVVALETLFKSEAKPTGKNHFLDQQYIDFLAQNKERLDQMHWRNFERLTSEFFNQQGYQVSLGPGTNDGGIDVRVWPSSKGVGPPLIVIQCKRFKQGNEVQIEHVKAFWTDVIAENAENGLIATTSVIAPGGKKICSARNWQSLEFAEGPDIHVWLEAIRTRHKP